MRKENEIKRQMSDLSVTLGEIRKNSEMFSIQKAACSCGVTEMTIRNFEKGLNDNGSILLYYLREITRFDSELWEVIRQEITGEE